MKETYPERYRDYFGNGGITSKVRLDEIHRQRYHRMAEVNALVYKLGVSLFAGTKPPFDAPFAVEPLTVDSQSRYYTSFEIKAIGDEAIKIAGSRAMGLLRTGNGAYLVYNTGSNPLKWEEMTEYKARTLVGNKVGGKVDSIMLGADMDCAYELICSTGGRLNRYYRVSPERQDRTLFAPFGDDGEFQLRFCLYGDSLSRLRSKLLAQFPRENGDCTLTCDGFIDANTGVLFACDFDMVRILLFKLGLEIRKMQGVVYCFDFQADVLQRSFGDLAVIRSFDSAKTAELFGLPYRGAK